MNHQDISGSGVTLDLNELRNALAAGVGATRAQMERSQREVLDGLELAFQARMAENPDETARQLCHANTYADFLKRDTDKYAKLVEQFYHVSVAIDRGVCKWLPAVDTHNK